MLVVQHVGLNNNVVVLGTELASSILSEIVIESFTSYQNVGALTDWSHVGVHGVDSVWKHREVTGGPGVGVQGNGHQERLTLFNEWELIVDGASDGVGVKELSLSESVTDSTSELGVLEVVSESATDDVNGTLTVVWSNQWSDIIDDALSVVMEVTESLLNTLEFDGECN